MTAAARAYVTYFDQRYLACAHVMLRSLLRHDANAEIFALCFDQISEGAVARLGAGNIVVVSRQAIDDFEPRLRGCADRTRAAYYATHKPVLPLYALSLRPHLASITHIDADTLFFSSPAPLFREIGDASIAVSPHGFSKVYESHRIAGEFNAGFIYWRNDSVGRRCLADYRESCLKWCEPTVEADGRFMNQGYLNSWPRQYSAVHVIRHPGVNLAWWNMAAHKLAKGRVIRVDGEPLIFYHFSGLVLDSRGVWRTHREFGDNLQLGLQAIYAPYLKQVEKADRQLRKRIPELLPIEKSWEPQGGLPARAEPKSLMARILSALETRSSVGNL